MIFSLSGFREGLKHQYNVTHNDSDKNVIINLLNFSNKLISDHGLDVLYKIPDDKILLTNYEKQKYSQFKEDGITEKFLKSLVSPINFI